MSKFTDDEKIIARNIDKEFKWIVRSMSGSLFVYTDKPYKNATLDHWIAHKGYATDVWAFDYLFESITWYDEEPTLIKDIYDPQILDDEKREYLTAVLKPLPKVKTIKKVEMPMINSEYLMVIFHNREILSFPFFKSHAMYKGMEVGREYTLKELGLEL